MNNNEILEIRQTVIEEEFLAFLENIYRSAPKSSKKKNQNNQKNQIFTIEDYIEQTRKTDLKLYSVKLYNEITGYVILTNEGIDYSDLNVNIILKSSEFSQCIVCEMIELINDIAAEYKKVIIQIKKIDEEYSFVLLSNGFKRIRKKANSEVLKYERYNNCK